MSAMSDERLAELQSEGRGMYIEEMWPEALAEIKRLRSELDAERAAHAKTADNFEVFAGIEDTEMDSGIVSAVEQARAALPRLTGEAREVVEALLAHIEGLVSGGLDDAEEMAKMHRESMRLRASAEGAGGILANLKNALSGRASVHAAMSDAVSLLERLT